MIDRAARENVIEAIDGYLNDRIDAFEFDEQLWDIESGDETVSHTVWDLSFFYDDCTNHEAVLQKDEWDFFQRIRLLLMSDWEVVASSSRRWSWDHALAGVGFVAWLILAYFVGWNWNLLLLAIPFGLLSMGISRHRAGEPEEDQPEKAALYPFDSWSQIRAIRCGVPEFSKQLYRREIGDRQIRGRPESRFLGIYSGLLQILAGPFVLFFQSLGTPIQEGFNLTQHKQDVLD